MTAFLTLKVCDQISTVLLSLLFQHFHTASSVIHYQNSNFERSYLTMMMTSRLL